MENQPGNDTNFLSLLGVKPSAWMMCPSERLAVLGLVEILKPRLTLELGCAEGGMTKWLSQYSDRVVTVDLDSKIHQVTHGLENVTALCMTTEKAFEWIHARNLTFDLTIIDADHSRAGVNHDLEKSLAISYCIVLHDTYYPPCRAGMLDVLSGRNVYFDLELVPGGLQPDGLWGGLGIVLPNMPPQQKAHVTSRRSTFSALESEWRHKSQLDSLRKLPQTMRAKTKGILQRSRALLRE